MYDEGKDSQLAEFCSDINGANILLVALYLIQTALGIAGSTPFAVAWICILMGYLLVERVAIFKGFERVTIMAFVIMVGVFWAALTLSSLTVKHTQVAFLALGIAFITISMGVKYAVYVLLYYIALLWWGTVLDLDHGPLKGDFKQAFKQFFVGAVALTSLLVICAVQRQHFVEKIRLAMDERDAARKSLEKLLDQKTYQLQFAAMENRRVFVKHEQHANLATMVSGLAHELGTPIGNAVLSSSNMRHWVDELKQNYLFDNPRADELGKRVTQGTEIIARNLERANTLVSTFKQVSLHQLGNSLVTMDIEACIKKCVMLLHPTIVEHGVDVQVNVRQAIEMKTYPFAVEQIVTNLITNAIKHGIDDRTDGRILITGSDSDDQNFVVIDVEDNGRGIPPASLSKIFEPFYTTKRGTGGTGMGLSIVQHLATSILDGRIDVATNDNGTKFTVTLPKRSPETVMNDETVETSPMNL